MGSHRLLVVLGALLIVLTACAPAPTPTPAPTPPSPRLTSGEAIALAWSRLVATPYQFLSFSGRSVPVTSQAAGEVPNREVSLSRCLVRESGRAEYKGGKLWLVTFEPIAAEGPCAFGSLTLAVDDNTGAVSQP